jgi:hypothetical protein
LIKCACLTVDRVQALQRRIGSSLVDLREKKGLIDSKVKRIKYLDTMGT